MKHIVVCGHYECGGVKASLSTYDHQAPLENWIKSIRDVARDHDEELSKYTDFNAKFRKMVELNAAEQVQYPILICHNIFQGPKNNLTVFISRRLSTF